MTTESTAPKLLGIIQSRGLGDIVIALPIARHYHRQGWEVHWPICREFIPHFQAQVPWVNWHPVTTDQGSFFYDQPLKILSDLGCDEILPLYQALTGHPEFSSEVYFQHTKFDQYKYHRAGVRFAEKWRLSEAVTRDRDREQAVMERIRSEIGDQPYILVHVEGSDHRARFDPSILPPGVSTIEINSMTDRIWDWCTALDQAWAVILVDSVFSNLVDQLGLNSDGARYIMPRSHIGLTPVLGETWTWIENLALDPRARSIRA